MTARLAGLRPVNRADEARVAARLAKLMTLICVRNTGIEDLHSGTVPVTHTGDCSDVLVIDADGRQIAWPDVSHLDDSRMRDPDSVRSSTGCSRSA